MDYNARFYDPVLGRFTSPDSIVPDPGRVIGYNRYTYVNNNPVRYTDPSGHRPECGFAGEGCGSSSSPLIGVANEMGNFLRSKAAQYASYNPIALAFKAPIMLYNGVTRGVNAWQSGERNPGQLYLETTGINNFLDSTGAFISQMNSDYDTLRNKDAPFIDKVMPFTRMSSFMAETALAFWAGGIAAKSATPSTTTAITVYDPVYATQQIARQMIQNGEVSVSSMRAVIPSETANTFKPSSNISSGFKYQFNLNNIPVEFKWHSPDARAFNLHGSVSNSGTMWTAQITVNGELLGVNMQFYTSQMGNLTHIAITQ